MADAVHQVVRTYGGLDLLVSNAGVLRAARRRPRPKDFDLSTAVNYKGYFLCVQNAAPVLAIQHQCAPTTGATSSRSTPSPACRVQQELRLCRQQVRRHRADPVLRPGACARRDQGQLGLPGQLLRRPAVVRPRDRPVRPVLAHREGARRHDVDDVKRFYEGKVPMGAGARPQTS